MSTTPSPDRRFIVALTAAVASATLAIGVTTGALLGWIGPSPSSSESAGDAPAGAGSAQVVYVPIAPSAPPSPPPVDPAAASEPRLALAHGDAEHGDRDDHDDRGDHDDHEEGDDD